MGCEESNIIHGRPSCQSTQKSPDVTEQGCDNQAERVLQCPSEDPAY